MEDGEETQVAIVKSLTSDKMFFATFAVGSAPGLNASFCLSDKVEVLPDPKLTHWARPVLTAIAHLWLVGLKVAMECVHVLEDTLTGATGGQALTGAQGTAGDTPLKRPHAPLGDTPSKGYFTTQTSV